MSLLEDIRASASPKGPSCSVNLLLDTLPESDRADLQAAFTDPTIPSTAIARVLVARGQKVTPDILQRHRRGDCKC